MKSGRVRDGTTTCEGGWMKIQSDIQRKFYLGAKGRGPPAGEAGAWKKRR